MQDPFASFFNLSTLTNTKNGHKGGLYAPLRPFYQAKKFLFPQMNCEIILFQKVFIATIIKIM